MIRLQGGGTLPPRQGIFDTPNIEAQRTYWTTTHPQSQTTRNGPMQPLRTLVSSKGWICFMPHLLGPIRMTACFKPSAAGLRDECAEELGLFRTLRNPLGMPLDSDDETVLLALDSFDHAVRPGRDLQSLAKLVDRLVVVGIHGWSAADEVAESRLR